MPGWRSPLQRAPRAAPPTARRAPARARRAPSAPPPAPPRFRPQPPAARRRPRAARRPAAAAAPRPGCGRCRPQEWRPPAGRAPQSVAGWEGGGGGWLRHVGAAGFQVGWVRCSGARQRLRPRQPAARPSTQRCGHLDPSTQLPAPNCQPLSIQLPRYPAASTHLELGGQLGHRHAEHAALALGQQAQLAAQARHIGELVRQLGARGQGRRGRLLGNLRGGIAARLGALGWLPCVGWPSALGQLQSVGSLSPSRAVHRHHRNRSAGRLRPGAHPAGCTGVPRRLPTQSHRCQGHLHHRILCHGAAAWQGVPEAQASGLSGSLFA